MESSFPWQDLFELPDMIFLFNLLLCLVLGFMIGAERESRSKDAGISTHILVILGAMMFTFISNEVDPVMTRIAAEVVSGVGFLGAGMILKDGDVIRNLTTAASIWFAASIGMAIGFQFYMIAIFAGIAGTLIPRIPNIHRLGLGVTRLVATDDEHNRN